MLHSRGGFRSIGKSSSGLYRLRSNSEARLFSTNPFSDRDLQLEFANVGTFWKKATNLLFDAKERERYFSLQKSGILPTDSYWSPVWTYICLENPLLKKYGVNGADLIEGSKFSYVAVNHALSTKDFYEHLRGEIEQSESHDFLSSVQAPEVYTAWRASSKQFDSSGMKFSLKSLDVTSVAIRNVVTKIVPGDVPVGTEYMTDLERAAWIEANEWLNKVLKNTEAKTVKTVEDTLEPPVRNAAEKVAKVEKVEIVEKTNVVEPLRSSMSVPTPAAPLVTPITTPASTISTSPSTPTTSVAVAPASPAVAVPVPPVPVTTETFSVQPATRRSRARLSVPHRAKEESPSPTSTSSSSIPTPSSATTPSTTATAIATASASTSSVAATASNTTALVEKYDEVFHIPPITAEGTPVQVEDHSHAHTTTTTSTTTAANATAEVQEEEEKEEEKEVPRVKTGYARDFDLFPPGSVLAYVDVQIKAHEESEIVLSKEKSPDGKELRIDQKKDRDVMWSFRACISGQVPLEWKLVDINGGRAEGFRA